MDLMTILSMPLIYLIPFIIVLGIIIFVHELGHFLVARWCGVKVEAFSIGFGKELAGWVDKHGTRWKLCWVLLGGYVKFEGDANAASLPDGSASQKPTPGMLQSKPVWQRMAVVAAGPIANFLLAIAIFAGVYGIMGIPDIKPVVGKLEAGGAAEMAGIRPGDIVREVDGAKIETFSDLTKAVWGRGGETLSFVIERQGQSLTLPVTPLTKEEPDGFNGKIRKAYIGVYSEPGGEVVRTTRLNPLAAIGKGIEETWFITATTIRYIGKLFTGEESGKQIGSAISIAKGAGDAASSGLLRFATYIALISISVGILNLFPIPMLDGGHLLLYSIEAVAGKPLGPKAQEWSFRVGFSLVIMLMAFGLWNDFGRVFAPWLGS
jgi:regulator of sigma E protease